MATPVSVGQALEPFVIESVDPQPMKVMAAILQDPNPIHFDTDVTRELGMGEHPVNQGPTNMTWLLECVSRFAGGTDRIRSVNIRFLGNVLGGDRFEVTGTVTSVDEAAGEAELELTGHLRRASRARRRGPHRDLSIVRGARGERVAAVTPRAARAAATAER